MPCVGFLQLSVLTNWGNAKAWTRGTDDGQVPRFFCIVALTLIKRNQSYYEQYPKSYDIRQEKLLLQYFYETTHGKIGDMCGSTDCAGGAIGLSRSGQHYKFEALQ